MGEAGLYALSTSWDEAPGIWWDYYQVYNRAWLTPPCSSIACQRIGRQQAECYQGLIVTIERHLNGDNWITNSHATTAAAASYELRMKIAKCGCKVVVCSSETVYVRFPNQNV
jgi:hypothetical protein